jgi:hypothetical protein
VAPQQVQNPGRCGCARTVHSQYKQLHVLFPASFRRFHDASSTLGLKQKPAVSSQIKPRENDREGLW